MATYICTCCGKRVSTATREARCSCGGLFELEFDAPKWDASRIDRSEWSLFRYRDFLALDSDTWRSVTMGEGMTPIIRLDKDVLLKMDYTMPTLSFKDRGAVTLVSHMKAIGVTECVQDSSGNGGNAVAAYCARAGIACTIYVPEGTSPAKIQMIESYGIKVNVVPGSRDNCADVCRRRVFEDGVYYGNHVFNPYFYEGMKTYIYETFEQLGRIPANIILPVGNGTLFIGTIKALEHLEKSGAIERFPNIIALQSSLCDPLARAAEQGLEEPVAGHYGRTHAEGIAIGVPMRGRELLAMARKHNVQFIRAPEDKILAAQKTLASHGVYCEVTTAANYAAYLEYCRIHGETPDTLITMCGAGIKSQH